MISLDLPLALLGLGALALPIAIHALARRTPRELALPTLRFLELAPRSRQGVALPQDRLVLVLRCLALAAFAVAAARPFLASASTPTHAAPVIVILDDSLSMAHGRARPRFARAQIALERALDALPAGSRVAVLLASQPKGELGSLASAREQIREATVTARACSLGPALEAAAELAGGSPRGAARVIVASDLDRPSLDGLERGSEAAQALHVETIDVGDDEPHDASFTDIEVSPSPAIAGEPVTVSARVRSVGLGSAPLLVALETDGAPAAERTVSPGERVRFVLQPTRARVVAGSLVLRPSPGRAGPEDELALDDRAWFATSVLRHVSVALLGTDSARKGAQGREQPVVDALTALARAQGLQVDVAVVSEPTLAASLLEASVLVLASPGELQEATRSAIGEFVRRGGGLVVLLDEHAPETTLRALAEKGILPATAHALEPGPAAPPHLAGIVPARGSGAVFEPAVARALAALALNPQAGLAPLPGTTALLAAATGEPLWVEKGRVVVLGFAPWGRNGALAREAAFPLLVRRALRAAIGSDHAPSVEAGDALAVSELARASGEPLDALARATLLRPDGSDRPLGGAKAILAVTPGIHILKDGDRVLAAFAVNASEREALLERAPPSARLLLAGRGTGAARPEALRAEDARDLTAPFVLGGLAFLLLASLAANRGLLALKTRTPTRLPAPVRT